MALIDVELPQLGETVEEGTLTRWFKQVGDSVTVDELLYEVSTEKVDAEVPSPVTGTIIELKVAEGETIAVGTVLAVVEGEFAMSTPEAEAPDSNDSVDSQPLTPTKPNSDETQRRPNLTRVNPDYKTKRNSK